MVTGLGREQEVHGTLQTCSISVSVSGRLANFLMLRMILFLAPFVTNCNVGLVDQCGY